MPTAASLDSLLADLASGAVRVVDLTAPLSPSTPVLQLPAPFANTMSLELEPVSNFDDDGPGFSDTASVLVKSSTSSTT